MATVTTKWQQKPFVATAYCAENQYAICCSGNSGIKNSKK